MAAFKKGDLVAIKGKVGTFEVITVTEMHIGVSSDSFVPDPKNKTAVEFAVKQDSASVVGLRGTGAVAEATPAGGAEVIQFHR